LPIFFSLLSDFDCPFINCFFFSFPAPSLSTAAYGLSLRLHRRFIISPFCLAEEGGGGRGRGFCLWKKITSRDERTLALSCDLRPLEGEEKAKNKQKNSNRFWQRGTGRRAGRWEANPMRN